jgi:hypothetical protein
MPLGSNLTVFGVVRASATEANPLGDLTLNFNGTDEMGDIINAVLETSKGKIQVAFYKDGQLIASFVNNVAKKQGSFLMDVQKSFAFNDDFIKTTTTCFDRSQPTSE